ncbi:unnamed protein product [Closterium sp. Naga37s-1]|nr:unnamed protein product [Closterium sp. Naga37s-1]
MRGYPCTAIPCTPIPRTAIRCTPCHLRVDLCGYHENILLLVPRSPSCRSLLFTLLLLSPLSFLSSLSLPLLSPLHPSPAFNPLPQRRQEGLPAWESGKAAQSNAYAAGEGNSAGAGSFASGQGGYAQGYAGTYGVYGSGSVGGGSVGSGSVGSGGAGSGYMGSGNLGYAAGVGGGGGVGGAYGAAGAGSFSSGRMIHPMYMGSKWIIQASFSGAAATLAAWFPPFGTTLTAPPSHLPLSTRPPFFPSISAAIATKHHPNLVHLLGYHEDLNPGGRGNLSMEQIVVYELMPHRKGGAAASHHITHPLSLLQVAAMATKHHPNLVRLLGYCVDMNPAAQGRGDMSMEQIVVYEFMAHGDLEHWVGEGAAQPLPIAQRLSVLIGAAHGIDFGVVMLMVLSARQAVISDGTDSQLNIRKWAEDLIKAGKADQLKDPRLAAPTDLILQMAQLALRCTAMPTVSRPDMIQVVSELTALRKAFLGEVAPKMAVRIDEEVEEQRGGCFEDEIAAVERIIMGGSTGISGMK